MSKILIIIILVAAAVVAGFYVFPSRVIAPGESVSPTTTPTAQKRTVKLYYYNPAKDQGPGGVQCTRNGLVAVTREIPVTKTPIQDTIRLLLKGELTPVEKSAGLTTEYPLPGLRLAGVNSDNGAYTLEFEDPQNQTGGGSCRVAILWLQIETTIKQFSEVKSVRFIPGELFQP